MLQLAFADEELEKALVTVKESNKRKKNWFPAHCFEANCLRAGITLEDLKKRSFVSVMKILFYFMDTNTPDVFEATQRDIDKFMS